MKGLIIALASGPLGVVAAADDADPSAAPADWHQQVQSSYTWKAVPTPDPEPAPMNSFSYLKNPVSDDSSDPNMLRLILSDSVDEPAHSLVPFLPAQRPTQPGIYWLGPLWGLSKFHPNHSLHAPHSLKSIAPVHSPRSLLPKDYKNMLPLLRFQ